MASYAKHWPCSARRARGVDLLRRPELISPNAGGARQRPQAPLRPHFVRVRTMRRSHDHLRQTRSSTGHCSRAPAVERRWSSFASMPGAILESVEARAPTELGCRRTPDGITALISSRCKRASRRGERTGGGSAARGTGPGAYHVRRRGPVPMAPRRLLEALATGWCCALGGWSGVVRTWPSMSFRSFCLPLPPGTRLALKRPAGALSARHFPRPVRTPGVYPKERAWSGR